MEYSLFTKLAAEFVGTAVLMIFGNGAVANVELKNTKGHNAGWLNIAMGYGFGVMFPVLMFGGVSGAHINPAMTLAQAVNGMFPWNEVLPYIIAQLLGAVAGQLIVYVCYYPHYKETENAEAILSTFCTTDAQATRRNYFINEFFGTMILVLGALCCLELQWGRQNYASASIVVGFIVCSFGLQKGLERVSKVMMLALLLLILVLAVHSLTLSGAAEGMKFYLLPSLDSIRENGLRSLITDAMNQAFFTLSLGIASMEIFGSYMSDDHALAGESIRICALDTFVALMAGTIIFPACFSYGVAPEQGPSLLFVTLPQVFVNMSGGRFWGTLFFLFMVFASMSTVLAVFENILAVCMDTFGWSRKKAVFINGVLLMLLSLPCVFGYNIWSDFHPILGKDVLDSEDFLVSNLLLPIGSLVYLLFCVTKWGWGFDKYIAEVNKGTGVKLSPKLKPYFQWVLPILIVIILLQGLL